MSITKATIQSVFAAARTAFIGANVTIRCNGKELTGTRIPTDKGETVNDEGTMFTVVGGVRLLTSEFARRWPKPGDEVSVKSTETGQWETFVIVNTRLDEMEATMLVTYGERYDEYGV